LELIIIGETGCFGQMKNGPNMHQIEILKHISLKKKNDFVGFYEQEYHPATNEMELINMGILKEFRGLKLGSALLNHAIVNSSRKNLNRMWVHTCSLDHKHALQNYKSKGFKIFKEEEIDFVA
jgi:GNAT superfamily N-acetyltransferase